MSILILRPILFLAVVFPRTPFKRQPQQKEHDYLYFSIE